MNKSNCCKAPIKTISGNEGTGYYECSKCGNPCDIFMDNTKDNKSTTLSAEEFVKKWKSRLYDTELEQFTTDVNSISSQQNKALMEEYEALKQKYETGKDAHIHNWDKYNELKEVADEMAEALKPLCADIKITNNRTLDYVQSGKRALSAYEKLKEK